ncbi:Holliday junction resolvase RecU [Mycoplasma corogypsi]|uniref:Holliday junction resolvase RecU n=1 Tax=Mycoplasma corogypsi TaxID=2106 RepID=UPI003873C5DD
MYKNKGMFLENIINQTIFHYWETKQAFIEKKPLDVKFNKVQEVNNKKVLKNAHFYKKSTVDYIGMYQGRFICFEAKTCNEDKFYVANLKEHQFNYLKTIKQYGGIAFLLIYFNVINKFIKIDIDDFSRLIENKKYLSIEEITKNSRVLDLEFPGIINLLD